MNKSWPACGLSAICRWFDGNGDLPVTLSSGHRILCGMFLRMDSLAKRLSVATATLGVLSLAGSSAHAQQFYEIGAGWSAVPSASTSGDYRFSSGPYFRGAIGQSLNSRIRLRFDANAMVFRLKTQIPVPCPSTGCAHPFYDTHIRGTAAFTASGLISVDPRGTVYLIGGAGAYDAETQVNSLHVGVLGGAGIAVPIRSRHRATIELAWHGLAPKTNGPAWLVPVSLGYRF